LGVIGFGYPQKKISLQKMISGKICG
jgi:hypothetical protein